MPSPARRDAWHLVGSPLVNSVEYNGKAVDTWVVGLGAPVPSK